MKMIHPRTTTSFALLILLCAPACAPQELDQGSLLDGFRRDDDERARLERRVTALERAIEALPAPRTFERSVALEQQHASMLVQIASNSAHLRDLRDTTSALHWDASARTLELREANLAILDGSGATYADIDDPARERGVGLGNLIVGYAEGVELGELSHSIVLGIEHEARGAGHIIAGESNTASARGAVVTGQYNTVSGPHSVALAGGSNVVTGSNAAAISGLGHEVTGSTCAAVAGAASDVSGFGAAIVGGLASKASGSYSGAFAADFAEVSGISSAAFGARDTLVSGDDSVAVGGVSNTIEASSALVLGGADASLTRRAQGAEVISARGHRHSSAESASFARCVE